MFFARLQLIFELIFKRGNVLLHFCIFFLLKHQLLDQVLALVLLFLKLCLQNLVFFAQLTVLSIGPLGDICDQLEVVLELVFALGLFSRFVATFGLLLLDFLFFLAYLGLVPAKKFFGLLIGEDFELGLVVVNVLVNGVVDHVDVLEVDLLRVILETFADPQLSLQLVDLLPVLLFVLNVTLGASFDLPLHLFVFFLHLLDLLLQVEVFVVPLRLLDTVGFQLLTRDLVKTSWEVRVFIPRPC